MSTGYAYHCDGPGCEVHTAPIATAPPYLPVSFLELRWVDSAGEGKLHFCGWDCAMKYAAAQPVPERIDMDGLDA